MADKKLNRSHWVGIIAGIILILISIILYKTGFGFSSKPLMDSKMLSFVLGISFAIIGLPFFINLIIEGRRENNVEQMFLEFVRDLVEGVRSGTPINKTIINLQNKDYGSLNVYISKLGNQIAMGIPVKEALDIFAKDINNSVISRSVSLIREAERSGGEIESILDSVTFSVNQIEKLKKERAAAIYSLTVQGYIIFMIFIVIMLVLEFQILPMAAKLGSSSDFSTDGLSAIGASSTALNSSPADFTKPFFFLLLTQGLFAGLIIGKISEGTVRAGYKHSFVLVLLAWLISSGAEKFIGG